MQYQLLIQNPTDRHYVASIIGIPAITGEGTTEEEAIAQAKAALKSLLVRGKVVTIDIDLAEQSDESATQMKYAGIFADDPTFEDWMEKLTAIRREANVTEAD